MSMVEMKEEKVVYKEEGALRKGIGDFTRENIVAI